MVSSHAQIYTKKIQMINTLCPWYFGQSLWRGALQPTYRTTNLTKNIDFQNIVAKARPSHIIINPIPQENLKKFHMKFFENNSNQIDELTQSLKNNNHMIEKNDRWPSPL
jgi:hypothetical protein